MDIRFFPTLKIIACTRIARRLLYNFNLEKVKGCDMSTRRMQKISNIFRRAFSESFEHCRSFEGAEHVILTREVDDQLLGVALVLVGEIRKWYNNHQHMFDTLDLDLRNKLTWFSFGVIDTLKTAQNFIRDENLNIGERFFVACKYYFEDDAKMLWRNMSPKEVYVIFKRNPIIASMEFWKIALKTNRALDWSQISVCAKKTFFKYNLLGVRNYFTKLIGKPIRYWFIFFASEENSEIHPFDLYSCIYQIGTDELNVIFNRLPSKHLAAIFQSFLVWPLQNMFLDFAKTFFQHINAAVLCDILEDLLFQKIKNGCKSHPYVNLLQEFLKVMNEQIFLQVKRNARLNKALKYVVNSPKPLDLRAYRRFLDNLG